MKSFANAFRPAFSEIISCAVSRRLLGSHMATQAFLYSSRVVQSLGIVEVDTTPRTARQVFRAIQV